MDVVTLHCACGRTVRAPGAVPGRVGRCPSCGATLVIPGARASARASGPRDTPPPAPEPEFDPDLFLNEAPPPEPDRVLPGKGRLRESGHLSRQPREEPKARLPKFRLARPPRPDARGAGSPAAYPFWDETALAQLALLPPAMTLPTLLSVGLIPQYILSEDLVTKLAATLMFLPMAMILANMVGFALMFQGDVLTSSAGGEHLHPKWPDWSPFGPIRALLQWVAAFGPGAVIGWAPHATWGDGFVPTPLNLALIAIGCLVTMAYGLVALYGAHGHEVLFVSPGQVLMGALRGGPGYARPVLLGACVLGALIGIVKVMLKLKDIALLIFLTWLAWTVAIYLTTVAMRSAGTYFRARRNELGWFADRPPRDSMPLE
jgi:hypothetical protein